MNGKILIKEISLISFGKFLDYKIDLTDGLNVIYGNNEAGKSTIQLFLKAMFYGLLKRKRSGESLKERDLAIPWGEKSAEGSVRIEINHHNIEIRRRFGRTSAGDSVDAYDLVTGEKEADLCCEAPGELLFGLSEESFIKTLWIRQNHVFMGGRNDEISEKLANLSSTGDETSSAQKAIDRLKAIEVGLKAPSARYLPGRIDILTARIENLNREKTELSNQINNAHDITLKTAELEKELSILGERIKEEEIKHNKSIENQLNSVKRERLLRIKECDAALDEIYQSDDDKKSRYVTDKILKSAEELYKELGVLENEKNVKFDRTLYKPYHLKRTGAVTAVGAGASLTLTGIISLIIAAMLRASAAIYIILTSLIIIGGIFTVLGIALLKKCNTKIVELNKIAINESEEERRDKVLDIKNKLKLIFMRSDVKSLEELRSLYNIRLGLEERIKSLNKAKIGFLEGDTYEELEKNSENVYEFIETPEEISGRLDEMRSRQMKLIYEINGLRSETENEVTRLPSDIDTEIRSVKDEIKQCAKRLETVRLAVEGIKEANRIWNSEFTPKLNKAVSDLLKRITSGRYVNISIDDNYKIKVFTEKGLISAEYLSSGTYEQIYLAMRLALAEMLAKGKILFLDDILTMYDNERADGTLRLLSELGIQQQIILFTCRSLDSGKSGLLDAHIINI